MAFQDIINFVLPQKMGVLPHITGHYGEQRPSGEHGGTDFNYEGGQTGINLSHPPVYSPTVGTVTFAGGDYGTVKILDSDGYSHEILHLDEVFVKVGSVVTLGDKIGTMGGRGPGGVDQYDQHVHYQLKDVSGTLVNPEQFWEVHSWERLLSPQRLLIILGEDSAPSDLIADAAAAFDRAFTSPIVIDLDNNGFGLLHAQDGVHFDIDADGFAEKTGWIKPTEDFLVRDVNGNGVIDSQAEMFGTDATSSAAEKLAAMDKNGDGFVTSKDAGWGTLRLWHNSLY